jgi:branched-chain amino acid transport system substrate-binding protein
MMVDMLVWAIERARTMDACKVAVALEGTRYEYFHGAVQMRGDDHQLIQPLFVHTPAKSDAKLVRFESEDSGIGWRTEKRLEGRDATAPGG